MAEACLQSNRLCGQALPKRLQQRVLFYPEKRFKSGISGFGHILY